MNSAAAAPGVTSTSSGAEPAAPAAMAARAPAARGGRRTQDEVLERDREVAQRGVGDGALGEVGPDPGVAELLGRLGLDRHPAVVHGPSQRAAAAPSPV